MCSGRVDLSFVLRAFLNGMDGVFIGGCHLNECHYITEGNHHAFGMVQLCKRLLEEIGLNPNRLRIEQLSAGEGIRFAEAMNEFSRELREFGPLGKGEGVNPVQVRASLKSALSLVPYIRLVERERLRIHCATAEEYESYFRSDEVQALIQELIVDKLIRCRILELLREQPRSAGELSRILGLSPSVVARHMTDSTRLGLARFEESRMRFVPA